MGANFAFISYIDKETKFFNIFEEKIILFTVILLIVENIQDHLKKTIQDSEKIGKRETIITIIGGDENESGVERNVGLPSTE